MPRPSRSLLAALRVGVGSVETARDLAALASLPAGADLLLADVHTWDPIAALLALRRREAGDAAPPLPILGFSRSAGDEEARARALEAGCTAYVASAKPSVLVPAALRCLESVHQAQVAEVLVDLVPDYLARRRDDALALELVLGRGDFAALHRIGHRMRGSGAGYGFAAISVVGRMLEDAAERRDPEAARSWTAKLSGYLTRVEVAAA